MCTMCIHTHTHTHTHTGLSVGHITGITISTITFCVLMAVVLTVTLCLVYTRRRRGHKSPSVAYVAKSTPIETYIVRSGQTFRNVSC